MGKTEGTLRVSPLSQFSIALYKLFCPVVATPAPGLELLPFWERGPGTSHTTIPAFVSLISQRAYPREI